MKTLLVLVALALSSGAFAGPDFKTVQKVRQSITNQQKFLVDTDRTVDLMIQFAITQLRLRGHHSEADRIRNEWDNQWHGVISNLDLSAEELGDWPPLSEWLADTYDRLDNLFGPLFMAMTHLDDIKIVNYGIPVVFEPCDARWDMAEYQLHFVPLAGVVTYWTAWGVCVGATWGGGIMFICTPIGTASEHFMVTFVAPGISDRFYTQQCM